jgi:4-hydroxybenzoate polyprenyltransferase
MSNWALFLRLGRVSNLPTVWSNVLAGMVLSGQFSLTALPLLLTAVSLCYIAGMFLNDAFDRHIDAVERPERPIPSGRISARAVFAAGYAMMAAGMLLLVPLGVPTLLMGLLLCGLILLYDRHHKGNPFSPVIMGLCRAAVYLLAAAACAGPPPLLAATLMTAYIAGLTYTAKQENLLEFRNAWPLAIFAVPLLWVSMQATVVATPFLLLFLAWTSYAIRLVLVRRVRNIRKAVASMLAGISLLDAVLIAEAGWPDIAALAIASFLLTLALHRRIPGT